MGRIHMRYMAARIKRYGRQGYGFIKLSVILIYIVYAEAKKPTTGYKNLRKEACIINANINGLVQ